jgi:hypothetical protein
MKNLFVFSLISALLCSLTEINAQTYKDITTSNTGEVAGLLGADVDSIDSLVVRGPINEDDFKTMWHASFYGNLSVINLENANIEGGVIPKNAFCHLEEQLTPDWQYIDCIKLRRMILPEGVVEIGYGAFSYCIYLEDVNIPSTLRRLNNYSFSECISLKTDPLIFPEGMKEIASLAFQDCRSLTGEVVLPSTIKKIGAGAFFSAKITKVNLPEGLEEIGDAAFYACRLKEVYIPNSCQLLSGASHFQLNYGLEKIHLPEGITAIPQNFLSCCLELSKTNIPTSVKSIDESAFFQCRSLENLELPEGLENIGENALWYLDSLEQVEYPSTLKKIGKGSCDYWASLKRIYCKAPVPPVCEGDQTTDKTPWGDFDSSSGLRPSNDIPVYVPIGTAELYRNAWGWNYFNNIIETDNFPGTTSIAGHVQEQEDLHPIFYDLTGKKINKPINGRIYLRHGEKVLVK